MSDNHTRLAPSQAVHTVDGTTIVALHGEIDLVTAMPLAACLDALASGPRPDLVVDLRPVSFIDCSGLGVLCRTRNRVLARHGRLRLVIGSRRVLRILRAAGLSGVFEVHPDLSRALGRAPTVDASPVALG
ncbi:MULTISPECIES: STAS domain-containing protein [unclassified Streptomyces]|uniref:STAS domain-containing protein n=1 Tax=unclassified Streptomyces TaxID=2593676 RepID=UPI00236561F3|nr:MULTISPECIES: STAS domain-containing protein [unclassified Streptomyces]MDF3145444.1 STAS domain-containing protein [Streptomyces sp. T21Q-yed]WDF39663.1 STAS domain-containing protein [Streptomyces sp. T12]